MRQVGEKRVGQILRRIYGQEQLVFQIKIWKEFRGNRGGSTVLGNPTTQVKYWWLEVKRTHIFVLFTVSKTHVWSARVAQQLLDFASNALLPSPPLFLICFFILVVLEKAILLLDDKSCILFDCTSNWYERVVQLRWLSEKIAGYKEYNILDQPYYRPRLCWLNIIV